MKRDRAGILQKTARCQKLGGHPLSITLPSPFGEEGTVGDSKAAKAFTVGGLAFTAAPGCLMQQCILSQTEEEARSLRARCQQGHTPSEDAKERLLSRLSPPFWQPQVFLRMEMRHSSPLPSHGIAALLSSFCESIFVFKLRPLFYDFSNP